MEKVMSSMVRDNFFKEKLLQYKDKKDSLTIKKGNSTDKIFNLSISQQRIWFLEKLHPNTAAYNIPITLKLEGNLNDELLCDSINFVLKRHQILRTSYIDDFETPKQKVKKYEMMDLEVVNLTSLPYDSAVSRAMQLIQEKANSVFSLLNDDLYSFCLFRVSDNLSYLLLNFHHSIADGYSVGIFWSEMCDYYNSNGEIEKSYTEMPFQYYDYIKWEEEKNQKDGSKNLNYWKKKLKDFTPLQLNTFNKIGEESKKGKVLEKQLSNELTKKIEKFCKFNNVTQFIFLMSAFKILLFKYTNTRDLIVGTPVLGRSLRELESIIGLFVNTLPIRTEIIPEMRFKDFLYSVKEAFLEAIDHQDIPFDKIVSELKPDRNYGSNPFFQTTFTYQPLSNEKKLSGINGSRINIDNSTSKFDFSFFVSETENQTLNLAIEYDVALYDDYFMNRILERFEMVLTQILDYSNTFIKDISIVLEEELTLFLNHLNRDEAKLDSKDNIISIFEKQVKTNPQKIAVKVGGKCYTYSELNNLTNNYAKFLIDSGVKKGEFVGIYLKKSMELIASILGILKAGAAYVPIDPNYPSERVNYILRKSSIDIVITSSELQHEIEVPLRVNVDDIRAYSSNIAINTLINPDDAAYMIFTSGSTGSPKGVVIAHKSVCNLIRVSKSTFHITIKDIILQFASICFDASVLEIFSALGNGATLFVLENEIKEMDTDFVKQVTSEKVTLGIFSHSFLASIDPEDLPTLKKIVLGGEKCTAEVAKRWSQSKDFWNAYGPTEATVFVTAFKYTNEDKVPIGKPIQNSELYILNENKEFTPFGMPGELYIGGSVLSKGYFNEPDLTKEKFVPNPFNFDGSLLYQTGDLVRYLPDGNLEFLERIDKQVKIRGYRVELGEIENNILKCDGIENAVVVLDKNSIDSKLIAYIVMKKGNTFSENVLKNFLYEKLPRYMVPTYFFQVEKITLTQNGKVDKDLLPVLNESQKSNRAIVKPKTAIQKKLVEIWNWILKTEVGIEDNFFDLGGDSLQVLKVISKLRSEGLFLTPKIMYQHPTINELSTHVDMCQIESASLIEKEYGSFPLSPIQNWFFEQNFTDKHHWNFPLIFDISSEVSDSTIQNAIDILISQHDSLRLTFHKEENKVYQTYGTNLKKYKIKFVEIKETENILESVEELAKHYQGKLDLEHILFKPVLFKLKTDKNILLLIMHHLITDWVSGTIIYEDFKRILEHLHKGMELKLPIKSTSYRNWIKKLNSYSHSSNFLVEKDYWLKNQRVIKNLPLDYLDGKNLRGLIDAVEISFDMCQTREIINVASNIRNATVADVILSAVTIAISEWTSSSKILIDLDSHGRIGIFDDIDISRTVGWFTSLYPLYFEIEKETDLKENIRNLKIEMEKIPNIGIGYGILRYLNNNIDIKYKNGEILFNFFGNELKNDISDELESVIELSEIQLSRLNSPLQERFHKIEIIGIINSSGLSISILYSKELHKKETIERIATRISDLLQCSELLN